MTDKYTQTAEEWLSTHRLHGGTFTPALLAALLRRVAREQIEEDVGIARHIEIQEHLSGMTALEQNKNTEAKKRAYRSDGAGVVVHALRSRAKELED